MWEKTNDLYNMKQTIYKLFYFIETFTMLSVSHQADSEAIRRKSCPTYHVDDANHVVISSRAPPLNQPMRSSSTTERMLTYEDSSKVQVHRTLHRFEDELKRAFAKMRFAGHQFKDRISPQRDGDEDKPSFPDALERTLHIIHSSHCSKKKQSSLDDLMEADLQANDSDINANPALTLESLQDGCFCASITLNKFPHAGDIIIRTSGLKLDFYWIAHRPKSARKSNHVYNQKPTYCNGVDLPMYVDPLHLNFCLVNDSKIAIMGQTKGSMGRRKSISSEDLSIDKFFTPIKSPRTKKKERFRKRSPAVLHESLNESSRTRAYTS